MKNCPTLLALYGLTTLITLGAAEKRLPIKGEVFTIEGHTAFLILPDKPKAGQPIPWLWYAPTLRGLPGREETWMFERFLKAGIAIAGVDVGEPYGSPGGRKIYSALHKHLVDKRAMARQACLLGRSRGGLMLYCWAAENPEKVRCITGIYPVCNIASYPGINRACGAYGLTAKALADELAKHNPIDRLAALAKAKVPIFHIHGDKDGVVPLDKNSAIIKQRYDQLGGPMILEVVKGQGHNMWAGWFQSQNLVDFVIKHATKPLQKKTSPASAKIQPAQGPVTRAPGPGKGHPVDKLKLAKLAKSLQLWKKLKAECKGNYTYSKRWSSWVGFGHVTEVVVADNKVVERRYKAFAAPPRPAAPGKPPAKGKETGWSEKGTKLGSHKEGHPAKTIDQLYEEAKLILNRPLPAFQRLGLHFDAQGLLLACYTQDTRIADDAPTKGVSISAITLGK